MAQQSKGLPAHLIPSAKSAYIMAYRAERAMYNGSQVFSCATVDWDLCYSSCLHFHPEAARMASVSFQTRHYPDMFAWGWTARYSKGDISRARSRVRRLPASRLPGIQPEAIRQSHLFVNRCVDEVLAGFYKSASFKAAEAESDEIRKILGL